MLGALRIQLTELGVAAVRAQPRGDLGVAPPGQLGDGGAPVGGVTEQLRAEEHPLDVHPALLQLPGRLHGERGARGVAPQQDPGQAAPGDLGDDLLDHLLPSARTARARRPGRDRAARRRRPPARCRAVRWPSAGSSPRCRRRRGSTPGRRPARRPVPTVAAAARSAARTVPSTSAARSARTGWRVTSLRDTARSRVIASFTADSDVPPRSKKWSRRPIWSCGMPSTFAQAAASRCSVGVLGALVVVLGDVELCRRAPSAPSGRSCCWRSAAGSPASGRPTGPCTRAATRPAGPAGRRPRAAAGRSRRPPGACCWSARSATTTAPSRTPGTRSRVFSISPISIRKPRILTWVSRRPRNSSLPSGCQRP